MLSLFKKHKALFTATLLTSVLFSVAVVGSAFILQYILDAVTTGNWMLFRTMLWVVPAYILIVGLLVFLSGICSKKLIMLTVRDVRRDVYNGILSRDTETFQSVNTADYISALTNDIQTLETNGLIPTLQVFQYACVFQLAAAALLYYSPLMAALMLVCLVAMYLIPACLGKPISRRQEQVSKSFAAFTVGLKDRLAGFDVIRSFQLSGRAKSDFAMQNDDVSKRKYAVDRFAAASESISQILGAGTQLLVMLASGYFVLSGNMTAGVMLGILELSGSFVQPVAVIMQNIPLIRGVQPVLERLQHLSTEQPSAFQGKEEPRFDRAIQFDTVSFGYKSEQMVLDSLDVTLQKNRKYAVTGPSGSGKTTLVKLLGAGYSGYTGNITVDGKELHELDIDRLLGQISLIHQNVFMFDETIRDNISLHREYSDLQWHSALATSGVDRFLPQMENGLDTPVGENGQGLSGGQRQRVAVARALIQKKPLLILDEGTSAVDRQTAFDIETALLETPDITMITITHNLSPELLRQYDSILFMEDGRIAEAGDYDTLVRKQARFAEFIQVKRKEAV